jgi:hypothetical protein
MISPLPGVRWAGDSDPMVFRYLAKRLFRWE